MARRKSYRGTPAEHRKIAVENIWQASSYAKGVLREVAQNECLDAAEQLIYMERSFARYKANRDMGERRRTLTWNQAHAGPKLLIRARHTFFDKCIVKRKRR